MAYEQMSMLTQLNTMDCTYKSPNLIMSSYELSLTEQRIVALGCKKIKPIYIEKKVKPEDLNKVLGAMHFSDIVISTSEYKKEYEIKGNNVYQSLEDYTEKLYGRSINYFDENNVLQKKRWVSSAKFDRENGKIALTFNPDMILDLLVLKGRFVALFFDMSQNVKSKYAFRNYEILKNHLYLGKFKVSVEEYRFMLKLTDKYNSFKDLNKKVIKPNLDVINKYSDIIVTHTTIRSGQFIKWIEFDIKSKNKHTIQKENDFKERIPTAFNEISNGLSKYKVELTSEDAEKLFDSAIEVTKKKHKDTDPVTFILSKIEVLDNYILTKDIDNVIGFLSSAIKRDWKLDKINAIPKVSSFTNIESREYTDTEFQSIEDKLTM